MNESHNLRNSNGEFQYYERSYASRAAEKNGSFFVTMQSYTLHHVTFE